MPSVTSRDASGTSVHPLVNDPVPPLLEPSGSIRSGSTSMNTLDWRQAAGFGLLILGGILIALGWYGVSGTTSTAQQLAYFISGGLGGASIIAVGVALLISFEHASDRQTLERLNMRIDTLEFRLAAEFDAFRDDLRNERFASTSPVTRRAR